MLKSLNLSLLIRDREESIGIIYNNVYSLQIPASPFIIQRQSVEEIEQLAAETIKTQPKIDNITERNQTCLKSYNKDKIMKNIQKTEFNPYTGEDYPIELPAPEVVRQTILELEELSDGITVVDATEKLAEKFKLSEKQKYAKNQSKLSLFCYNVVAPQFNRLLWEGKLKQPNGPSTPYFPAGSNTDSSDLVLGETPSPPKTFSQLRWPSVETTALHPNTGAEYQITLPAPNVVKQALLDFDYPPGKILISDIVEALATQFGLAKEQREVTGGYGPIWRFHVDNVINDLTYSGKLFKIKRKWITNPKRPNIEPSAPDNDSPFSDEDTPSPEVVMAQNYRKHQDRLKAELLQNIMDKPPQFFEKLVLDLLVKTGYGHPRADSEVVVRSGDSGIDGIIYQDPLRLDVVCFQAKWLKNRTVGSPDIRHFRGVLTAKGISKGVFITTSGFSKTAKAIADESPNFTIVLIDGEELVQLMIDYDVGISLGDSYQLKEVDLDYFAIDDDDA